LARLQKETFPRPDQSEDEAWDEIINDMTDGAPESSLKPRPGVHPTNPKPTECVRCFSSEITAESDYDSWRCACGSCGHTWDERFRSLHDLVHWTRRPGTNKGDEDNL